MPSAKYVKYITMSLPQGNTPVWPHKHSLNTHTQTAKHDPAAV